VWNVTSEGTEPTQGICPERQYLAADHDGLCHSCSDCRAGQMCTRVGCFNCGAGTYDPDHDVLTPCVECPSGLTSGPEASTECAEEVDFWTHLEWLIGLFSALGFAPLSVECFEWCAGDKGDDDEDEEDEEESDVERPARPVARSTRAAGGGQAYTELATDDRQP